MSRVASNYTPTRYNNGVGQSTASFLSRSSSNTSSVNSIVNGGGRGVTVRSAAPPPVQKETVHACPLCNGEYKDPRVLPCTHTYCLNCIRDKLINNNRVTCPKCQHQVQPFDETQLNDLPRNLILSQEWRMSARPVLPIPAPKKPVTYQPANSTTTPTTPMPRQQDKRKSVTSESNSQSASTNPHGFAALVNVFNKSSGSGGNGAKSSRSSSVASAQPVVSNLVRIYSEVTAPKQQQQEQQQQKPRSDSVVSTGKHDELTRIFEQASNRTQQPQQQQQRTSSSSIIKRPSQAREEAYEEITWDSLVHGTTPAAPPFPDQWQSATENLHHPPQATERPISAASTDQHSNVDNLRDIVASIHQNIRGKTSPSFPQGPIVDSHLHSRPSTASHSHNDPDEDDDHDGNRTPVQQSVYAVIPPRQHSRQDSNADSVRSVASTSTSRHSPILPTTSNYQQRASVVSAHHQQQDEKTSYRAPSAASSSRRSSDRFPPPPQSIETLDLVGDGSTKPRSASSMSTRSSVYADAREPINTNENHLLLSERFNPDVDIPPPIHTNNSSRANSQIGSGYSSPANHPASRSVERDTQNSRQQQQHYLVPTSSSSIPPNVTSRVDLLLSDQKRLEREIEEQIKRLKYDYDDIRTQIDRKESSIHKEVKTIAARLDEDITEHYHRKQKIYANLAADTNTVGTELERLKSTKDTNNNKQQLWANLEQIELNIRNIRQAVEQHKETRTALTFAEGHRAIAADTIGQITYNQTESHRRHNSPRPPTTSSSQPEQSSTNITPYKYIKIDHLSTLEPEAIAMTENNKKILLGICNKLFILNEYGDTLKIIPLSPSIRGIAVSKKSQSQNIAYISHDETVSMIDIDSGQTLDCVKETDSSGETGVFLPLGIDTDNTRGDVYVCDYRNSCVIKFDDKLEFITQWRIYNHSDQYDEARPKLISVYGQRLYMIVEHSCKPYYNQGIAYTFSLHICDATSGNIIKIIDAELLSTQRLRWPCSVQAINNEKCYILDTMTSGKYFNGQWQKHWSRVLEVGQDDTNVVTELFQLDSEAATMAMTKQIMIIAANGDILFVDLNFLKQKQQQNGSDHEYQNLS